MTRTKITPDKNLLRIEWFQWGKRNLYPSIKMNVIKHYKKEIYGKKEGKSESVQYQ